jgi:photosystem II stability/assembly factor-like uncharacterized protein
LRNLVLVGTAVTRPGAVGSLYRLRTGGDWQTVGDIPADASVQAITPHPARENVVFLAARKGVYRSTDAGQAWARLDVTDEDVQFWSVVVSPHDSDVIFADTGPVGCFRSADGGDTWSKCHADHPERFKITFGHASRRRQFAACAGHLDP